jgi:hypothetical protein
MPRFFKWKVDGLVSTDEAPKEPDTYVSAEGDLPPNPDNLMAVRGGVVRQD